MTLSISGQHEREATSVHPAVVIDGWPLCLRRDRCGAGMVDDVSITDPTSDGRRRSQVLGG